MAPRRLLTIREAAHTLSVSERMVWRLIGLGELRRIKLGRSCRITADSIDALLKKGGAQ